MQLLRASCRRYAPFFVGGLAVAGLLGGLFGGAQEAASPQADAIEIRDFLLIGRTTSRGRTSVHTDGVEAQIVAGNWTAPKAGDTLTMADGTARTWQKTAAGEDGVLNSTAWSGGYAYARVEVPTPRAMVLDAAGHGMV